MKKVKKLLSAVLCTAMVFTSLATPTTTAKAAGSRVKSITLNVKSGVTIYRGTTKTVKVAGVSPKSASKKVTFKSSAPSVVKVSSKGVMKAVKAGKATVTVTSASNKKVTKKVKVTVKNIVKNIKNDKVSISLDKKTFKLSLEVKASELSFGSSKNSVATVNSKGVIIPKKAGTTKITVQGKKGSAKGAKQVITVVVKNKTAQEEETTNPYEKIEEPVKAEGPVEPEIIPAPETKVSYATVEEMKSADLKEGDVVKTEGYWEKGDDGAAVYEIMTYDEWYSKLPKDVLCIRSGNQIVKTPVDECGNHTLNNGLVARLSGNSYTPEQWGAKDGANLKPFIHMFAQVKTGRIDFAENKTYVLELVKEDNPYRSYMCGALLGGQYFYKPIMGNVHDLILDGHNCTITMPDDSFGDSGMGLLNFTQDIVNLEVKNFNFDGKGHTMSWYNKNSNHLIFYAPGALYLNGMGDFGKDHWRYDPTVKPEEPNNSFTKTKIENWQIHDNTFNDGGAMYKKAGDAGGDGILVINPDNLNGLYINNNEFYNWGRWVFAIDLGGAGERLYNISFNGNKCIGSNGFEEVNEDGTYKYLNEKPADLAAESEDYWRWRALGLIDFECKKCFTNIEMKDNYINGSGGFAINGNSKVSNNIFIENNYWKHSGGGYPYGFEFYSGFAKDLVVRNNTLKGIGFKAGVFTHNLTFENNITSSTVRTFGLAGDIVFKGNKKVDTSVITTLWNNEANIFYDGQYLTYDQVKKMGVNIVFKDNESFFGGIFTDMNDLDRYSYMNFDVDTDNAEIWKTGITAFGTNLKINPNAFTSKPQPMYIHGVELTKPYTSKNGLESIIKVKAGQTVATNLQEGYGVISGQFFREMVGIENFADYNGYNWGAYAQKNNYSNVKIVCTQDGYIPGTGAWGFRYQATHVNDVLNNTSTQTLQDHAYLYTDDNLYYTEEGGKLTELPTHTKGTVTCGELKLTYIGKIAKVKVVTE